MKYLRILALSITISLIHFIFTINAQESDSQRLQREFREASEKGKRDFNKHTENQVEAFNAAVEKERRDYYEFIEKMNREWDAAIRSTEKNWASFSDNGDTRALTKFKDGELILETQIQKGESAEDPRVANRLATQFERLKRSSRVSSSSRDNAISSSFDEKRIRAFLLPRNLSSNLKKIRGRVTYKNYVSESGASRRKLQVRVSMRKDHLKTREKIFLPLIKRYSSQFSQDVALVMAITRTESYFNPNARSHVAFGLMQLVPTSGAVEAHKHIYGTAKVVPGSKLLDPETNVMFGTAYLQRLANRSFRAFKDPRKVVYLVIAAYNTGPNNVAKAFYGGRRVGNRLSKATPTIRSLTPDQVYRKMVVDLPYEETRKYLPKVVSSISRYVSFRPKIY